MTDVVEMFDPEDPSCPRCGSSCDWEDCSECGGEGVNGHECGEDVCCCLHPDENMPCETCRGAGGWWRCLSSREYCESKGAS